MSYDELCKSIGIDREAITKTCAGPVSGAIGKEPDVARQKMGKRIKRPLEDWSHLVSGYGRNISDKLKSKHQTKNQKPK